MPSKVKYSQDPSSQTPVLNEYGIEDAFIAKLQSLKYQYRPDIRDRDALHKNFREKFEALNRVHLTGSDCQARQRTPTTRSHPAEPPRGEGQFARLLDEMLLRLEARSGEIELAFPCFIRKKAPVSTAESLLDFDVRMIAEKRQGQRTELTLEVVAPVTSLCPCSREISDYGAHNQRSHITIRVRLRSGMAPEELLRLAEDEASCEVFGLLKRPDEKWVTERAYDNPKFVEDLVRDIALRLMKDPRIAHWTVQSENFESIHNHSAYAEICGENA